MQFNSVQEEEDFDSALATWLVKYRHPNTADLALVMEKAASIGGLPCVSLFERSYRELLAEGAVKLVVEKLVEPVVAKSEVLTAEEYRKIPVSQVLRKYMTDRNFKSQVDRLIHNREI
jgi:hypothetical protein